MLLERIDFSGLEDADTMAVKGAIARGENFHPYIPENSLTFIIRNHANLKLLGVLEAAWLDAYVHAFHFADQSFATIKAVFDSCDRAQLRSLRPLDEAIARSKNRRVTIFRGCAGPVHSIGMSWTPSIDTAIKYAARHVAFQDINEPAVYITTVSVDEIYCQLNHYDEELIVHPNDAWKINVPKAEFRLDRPH